MRSKLQMLGTLSLSAAVALAVSTGISSAAPLPQADDLGSLGTSPGVDENSSGLVAEVNQAERNEAGNLLSIVWSLENTGDERVVLTWLSDRSYTYFGPYFSGVTALSPDNETRYHPVMDGAGECLCSGNSSANFRERIEPDEKVAYWSLFSVPEDVEAITVEIPGFEPIEDIPIS